MIPRATYRMQFQEAFGFQRAAALAPYLARLGVSHLYASPWLKARPGSTHGYDIVDHHAFNPELGGEEAFQKMVTVLRENGLKQILDFVPNHMGVGGSDNPLWLDVLEWGPDSASAGWFDINWTPDPVHLKEKLLVPFLGNQYGAELHDGKMRLKFDLDEGSFAVWAYDTHKLPICPYHYARILGDAHRELERIGDEFVNLREWRPQVGRRAGELKAELAQLAGTREDVRDAISEAVDRLNGESGNAASWRALDALIQDQYWRAAHFRVAADDINYRRFFNINELAGLRMELPDVFDHTHQLIARLLEDGTLDGLRIDHIDGLLNPKEYLERLRALGGSDRPFYLVVEKILAHHESLREDWPVEGTTGYEFTNLVLGWLVDPAGEAAMTRLYEEFTGTRDSFAQVVRDCKIRIMQNEMASELNVLAREAAAIADQNPTTADFTQNILRRGIQEIVAYFPVYRTYVDSAGTSTEADRRDLEWAVKQARSNEKDLDPSVFEFLYGLLSGDLVSQPRSGFSRHAVLRFAMKLQQYSGPVMAKGLEDTAFYRYNRFVALNEVGGHPEQFGVNTASFHKANTQRARRWPSSMLGTATHDTKRGEDTRARLAVLSELAEEWARQVQAWSRILRARRGDIEGTAPPHRNDEYLFYQLLVGTWPTELIAVEKLDPDILLSYTERLKAAMLKSMREAKVHTTWTAPNLEYEEAVLGFVEEALEPERSRNFFLTFLPFQERVAKLGLYNSLAQTVLKLTLPGVPDIYQGSEAWNLSMVDPDNRRPVDYERLSRMLDRVQRLWQGNREAALRTLLDNWLDGGIKLALTAALLHFRRDHPELFAEGDYEPLSADGDKADQVCAFLRWKQEEALVVAVARFPARSEADQNWQGTRIALSPGLNRSRWTDILSGRVIEAGEGSIEAAQLFAQLPVAVLTLEQNSSDEHNG